MRKRMSYARARQQAYRGQILEAAQAVVDGAVGTPTGVLVPLGLLDDLADAVDRADARAVESREAGA